MATDTDQTGRQETDVSSEDRSTTRRRAGGDQQSRQPTSLADARRRGAGRPATARTVPAGTSLRAVTSVPSGLPDLVSEELTGRQRLILEFIREWVERHGYPPSVREIGEAVGLSSSSTVHAHLAALQDKGYLRRGPTQPRVDRLATWTQTHFPGAEQTHQWSAQDYRSTRRLPLG